tara:strand:- start:93 stop:335 length:243 start_codon:yes stop_codon:yes gene_type:complete
MSYNYIINPITKQKVSIFSETGKSLLKQYVIMYKIGGGVSYSSEYYGNDSDSYHSSDTVEFDATEATNCGSTNTNTNTKS